MNEETPQEPTGPPPDEDAAGESGDRAEGDRLNVPSGLRSGRAGPDQSRAGTRAGNTETSGAVPPAEGDCVPAEEPVRRSERRLRLALEGGQMGMWDWDTRSNQAVWSEGEFALLGLPPEDGPVPANRFFDYIHPDDLPGVRRELESVLDEGTEFRREFRVIRADGEVRWVASVARLHRGESGEPLRMVGVSFDVTARKQAEAELSALNKNLESLVAERTSALELLRDVASMANRAQNVEEALEYCLARVCEHNGWSFGHAFLPADDDPELLLPAYAWYAAEAERFGAFRELTLKTPLRRGECLPGRVFATGTPDWTADIYGEMGARRVALAQDLGIVSTAAFPVMVEDRIVGVLEFFSDKPLEPDEKTLESMASVGTQLGRVIERKAFQDRLLALADEEHRRLGQELHDDVGQELTALALKAETLAGMLGAAAAPARELSQTILVAIDRTRRKTRALARGLVPMEIDAPGLEAALEDLALRLGDADRAACTFRCEGEGRVRDGRTATQLYRIAQEAAVNALRQSRTTHVEITLRAGEVATELEIRDDGPGLPPIEQRGPGLGLQIMRYRAGLIRGTLTVEMAASGGVRVVCRVAK